MCCSACHNFLYNPKPSISKNRRENGGHTASYTCSHADMCSSYRSGLSNGVFSSKPQGNILFLITISTGLFFTPQMGLLLLVWLLMLIEYGRHPSAECHEVLACWGQAEFLILHLRAQTPPKDFCRRGFGNGRGRTKHTLMRRKKILPKNWIKSNKNWGGGRLNFDKSPSSSAPSLFPPFQV